jgi:SAM-dependent methyltransferase
MGINSAVDWFGGEVNAEQAERLAALYDLDAPHGPDAAIDWFRAIAGRTGGPVLELGCGTGRVAIPLAQDGHDVVGLDRSPAMLARAERHARREGVTLRLVEGDMRSFSFSEAFPLIAIPFNTFLMLAPSDRWRASRACESISRRQVFSRWTASSRTPSASSVTTAPSEKNGPARSESGRDVTKFSSSRANVDQVDFRWWFEELDDEATPRVGSARRL